MVDIGGVAQSKGRSAAEGEEHVDMDSGPARNSSANVSVFSDIVSNEEKGVDTVVGSQTDVCVGVDLSNG